VKLSVVEWQLLATASSPRWSPEQPIPDDRHVDGAQCTGFAIAENVSCCGAGLAVRRTMHRAIVAVWAAALAMVVAAGIEFHDGEVMSGAGILVVAAGLGALATFLRERFG
jgi:hypothetical protein